MPRSLGPIMAQTDFAALVDHSVGSVGRRIVFDRIAIAQPTAESLEGANRALRPIPWQFIQK